MRLNIHKELLLVVISAQVMYYFIDLEPLIDFTDISFLLIFLTFTTLTSLVVDTLIRADKIGFLELDHAAYIFIYSYVINLIAYMATIGLVFFNHILAPMNLYLTDDDFFYSVIALVDRSAIGTYGAMM
jgi:hypothetical protein